MRNLLKFTDGQEDSKQTIHAYTDGSKGKNGVGSGIAVFKDNKLIAKLKYKLNWQCSNNQAEQLAILKALEYIQHLETKEREVLLLTDSRITLDLLQNRKKHTYLIENNRTKVAEMERNDWQVKFSWIKAHAGHYGNELADNLAKEAANSKRIIECYNRIPKSAVMSELNKQSVTQWQNEWDRTTKGAITK